MSFQAYIDAVQKKTGKTPEQLRDEFAATGQLQEDMKAAVLVNWLKETYGLGHGHSMAIWNVFVTSGWVATKHTKLK